MYTFLQYTVDTLTHKYRLNLLNFSNLNDAITHLKQLPKFQEYFFAIVFKGSCIEDLFNKTEKDQIYYNTTSLLGLTEGLEQIARDKKNTFVAEKFMALHQLISIDTVNLNEVDVKTVETPNTVKKFILVNDKQEIIKEYEAILNVELVVNRIKKDFSEEERANTTLYEAKYLRKIN